MARSKLFDVGGTHGVYRNWVPATEIWDLYVGGQTPAEWLRMISDHSEAGITAEVEAYLSEETPAHWLEDSEDDPTEVAAALVWMLMQELEQQQVEDPGYNVVSFGHPRGGSTRRSAARPAPRPYQRREPKPKGFLYSITYEVVTEESAQYGDAEDRGYEVEDVQVDTLQDLAHEVDNYGWIEDSGRWFNTEAEQDMHSGDYTTYSLHVRHLDGTELSDGEYRKLKALLGVR